MFTLSNTGILHCVQNDKFQKYCPGEKIPQAYDANHCPDSSFAQEFTDNQMEKVSSLLVTLNRFESFERSFRCYREQTYPSRELVIVCDGEPEYTQRIGQEVKQSGRKDVRTIFLPRRVPLGTLRNIAVEAASGEFVCQWDDDDLSHPDRVAAQVAALDICKADACFLVDHLHLFSDRRQVFWCDWTRASRDLGHAGTLLVRKRCLPRYDPYLPRGEDSRLQGSLCGRGVRIALIRGMPHLYVYVYHGANVWGAQHHRRLACRLGVEAATLERRAGLLMRALKENSIEAPVQVVDHLGRTVFTWNGSEQEFHSLEGHEAGEVFSVASSPFGADQDKGLPKGAPWYVDALGAIVEGRFSVGPEDFKPIPSKTA